MFFSYSIDMIFLGGSCPCQKFPSFQIVSYSLLKGIIHLKINIILLFVHRILLFYSVEHKKGILNKVLESN